MPRSTAIAVRFDPDILDELRRLAELDDRPISGMVRKLVDEALAARRAVEEKN